MFIENNDVVLFQGDSVTDAGRIREDSFNLGNGYPMITASWFSALYPEKNVTFINRGVSGDRVIDLKRRWEEDCISIKPTVVSILIGINDCWRRYDSNDPTNVEDFRKNYEYILNRLKNTINPKIIMCEPFVLPVPEDRKYWREDLDPKINAVRELARQFKAILVPLDGALNSASSLRDPGFWAPDGVHPSPAGCALIAQEWLKAVKCI